MTAQNQAHYLVFSREEYDNRLRRARELMEAQGFDALLVSAPANVVYLTGYRTNLFDSNFRPFTAVIPRDGDPVLLLPDLEVGVGQEVSPFDDIRGWGGTKGTIAPDVVGALRIAIKDKKLDSARIGVEQGNGMRIGMGLDHFRALKEALPNVEWLDSSMLLWRMRSVKSPAEVAYAREAQRITDVSYQAALNFAKAGVTEREILQVMGSTMMLEGADRPGFICISSGEHRYKMLNPYASERALERGDMVIFDFGAIYQGYWGDITRGFFVGEVSARQRAFYEASVAITEETVKAVRPGVPLAEVDRVAESQIREHGYQDYVLHRTGHSIGLEVHEMPSIGPTEQSKLEPGMIITIEPAIYDFSIGAFRMEDVILVTEDGHEYLSHAERSLVVV